MDKELMQEEEILSRLKEKTYLQEDFTQEQWSLIKEKKRLAMALVQCDGNLLMHLPSKLRNDEDIVKKAVANRGNSIKYASKRLKNRKDIILMAIKKEPLAFLEISKESQKNKEIVIELLTLMPYMIQYCDKSLINDIDVAKIVLPKAGTMIKSFGSEIKDNKELALIAVKSQYDAYFYLSKDLQKDKEIIIASIKSNKVGLYDLLQHIKLTDMEIILNALDKDMDSTINALSNDFCENKSNISKILDHIYNNSQLEEELNEDMRLTAVLMTKIIKNDEYREVYDNYIDHEKQKGGICACKYIYFKVKENEINEVVTFEKTKKSKIRKF
jgi:hypothetical protein